MTTYYRHVPQDFQLAEATTTRRYMLTEIATSEAKTVSVSKAGAAFTASSAVATVVEECLCLVTLTADDLDTEGVLAIKLAGSETDIVYGMRVVRHDPYEDVNVVRQRVAGKIMTDLADNTLTVYDADTVTPLVSLVRTVVGTQTTWSVTT